MPPRLHLKGFLRVGRDQLGGHQIRVRRWVGLSWLDQLRHVLEGGSVKDVASGELLEYVQKIAEDPAVWT